MNLATDHGAQSRKRFSGSRNQRKGLLFVITDDSVMYLVSRRMRHAQTA
jgi:hypothetical protein